MTSKKFQFPKLFQQIFCLYQRTY